MILLHVHAAFIIRNFQFRQMRMNQRRPTAIRVYMEQGSISGRKNQRGQ